MFIVGGKEYMIQSKTLARLLTLMGTAVLALAFLVPAASAKTTPKEGYGQFSTCPDAGESATSVVCITSTVTGGHLQVGKKTVPIENPLTLAGGVNAEFEEFTPGPGGGLSLVKQKVPGGVLGLTGLTWLLEFFGSDALTLYATTELAGAPTGFTIETVTIPIKVHLTTPSNVLGSSCYIGSNSSPITLNLITGTTEPPPPNKPITGVEPAISVDGKGIVHVDNGTYVDNSFSAPGASGCVLKLFGFIPISLNGFVNEQSGTPSAAGNNEAVQEFDLEFVARSKVY
jgi:hypothetical protein